MRSARASASGSMSTTWSPSRRRIRLFLLFLQDESHRAFQGEGLAAQARRDRRLRLRSAEHGLRFLIEYRAASALFYGDGGYRAIRADCDAQIHPTLPVVFPRNARISLVFTGKFQ